MAELQARMSSREFSEWIAFAQQEPIGGLRGDVQAALIATMIANANRDPKKHPRPIQVGDLVLDYWPEEAGAWPEVAQDGKAPAPKLRSPDGAVESKTLYSMFRQWAMGAGAKEKGKEEKEDG